MTTKPMRVAIDGGSGNIALSWMDEESGNEITRIFPSLVVEGNLQAGNIESGTTWTTNDRHGVAKTLSVVSKGGVNLVDTCQPDYQLSEGNRVLVINALAQCGFGGKEVIIGDTLPINQYFHDNGQINQQRIEAKRQSLMQPVTNFSGTLKAPIIVGVEVFPEAIPAYAYAAYGAKSKLKGMFEGVETVLIVDIGRFTCDFAIVNSSFQIVNRRTSEHGIEKMLKHLHVLIQNNETALNRSGTKEYSLETIDTFIRNGFIGSKAKIAEAKRTDITHLIKEAALSFNDTIMNDIRSMSRSLIDIDLALVVGGGANYIGGKLPHVPNLVHSDECTIVVPDNPEYAIVSGVLISMLAETNT